MELLVVMVIIGLIAALVGPRLFPKLGKGKQAAAKAQIELLGQALDQFRLDVGRYPSTQEGLNALMVNPGIEKWEGPYLKKELPVDPWSRPYLYQQPGTQGEYDLYSFGSDGAPGERERRPMLQAGNDPAYRQRGHLEICTQGGAS